MTEKTTSAVVAQVSIPHSLTAQDLEDLMITAFGWIGYWCAEVRRMKDDSAEYETMSETIAYGKGVRLRTDEDDHYLLLNLSRIQNGLDLMAKDTHWHPVLERIIEGQYDVCDADVLVQMAVFEEVVYG